MINFIVCEDNKKINNEIIEIIDNIMMKNKLEYKKYIFNDYDSKFMVLINKEIGFKIYILDIETESRSGIDVAREIRKKDDDSIIIFLTAHDELGYIVLKNEFMFLSFISKFDDYQNKLKRAIHKSLKMLGKKSVLRYNHNGVTYTIPTNDILYITRDSVDRKIIIVTTYSNIKLNKTLTEMKLLLDDSFEYSHRACIVNSERIRVIDHKKKKIIFDDDSSIDLLSSSYGKVGS